MERWIKKKRIGENRALFVPKMPAVHLQEETPTKTFMIMKRVTPRKHFIETSLSEHICDIYGKYLVKRSLMV